MRARASHTNSAMLKGYLPEGATVKGLDVNAIIERLIEGGVARVVALGAGAARRALEGRVWVTDTAGATATYFDLASLTKPMTALAVGWSGLDVRAPLGSLVAEARGTASADVPLELLLAHRAGLEAHLPLFAPLLAGETVDVGASLARAADARRADAAGPAPTDGFAPVYSDLGYMLAGAALARHAGTSDAGEAIERIVVERLGLADVLGTSRALAARVAAFDSHVAPTEEVPWRGGAVRAEVHDENAWALTGRGGSGHAGMFGTVAGVLAFGAAALEAVTDDPRLSWMTRPRPGGTLLAGWDAKSEEGSSAGTRMGPRSFGHLGFTGTSVWIDPDARTVVTLLTNRVHPTRENILIRAARPGVHDALFERALGLR